MKLTRTDGAYVYRQACKPAVAMQVLVRPSKHANKSRLESWTPIRCCDPACLLEWRYLGIGLMVADGADPSQGHLENCPWHFYRHYSPWRQPFRTPMHMRAAMYRVALRNLNGLLFCRSFSLCTCCVIVSKFCNKSCHISSMYVLNFHPWVQVFGAEASRMPWIYPPRAHTCFPTSPIY